MLFNILDFAQENAIELLIIAIFIILILTVALVISRVRIKKMEKEKEALKEDTDYWRTNFLRKAEHY